MRKLISGIVEFRERLLPQYAERFRDLALAQSPDALFITCSDSRVVPDLLASTHPGDLFTMRNVGNLVPPATADGVSIGDVSEASAIEYAVLVLKVAHIVVCGHSECGAMKAVLATDAKPGALNLELWLHHAGAAAFRLEHEGALDAALERHDQLSQLNALVQMEHLMSAKALLRLGGAADLRAIAMGLHFTAVPRKSSENQHDARLASVGRSAIQGKFHAAAKVGNIWTRMSKRRITNAIAREKRAGRRAEQSVLRRQRDLQKIKVTAGKTKTRIKIVLGGDGLALEQGRISMEEFLRRAAKAGHEFREVNEALAQIGLRIGDGQSNASSEVPPALAQAPQDATPKPKKKIVRFSEPPPAEFRRKLKWELGLMYDPDSIYWCGDADPAQVESFIRGHGHWDLVRFFNGAVGSP